MRLLFIRHGDPDYENDSLTEAGIREAQALARLAPQMDLGTCYVSPLGRAQETAAITLQGFLTQGDKAPSEITTLDWLQEFPARINFQKYLEKQEREAGVPADPEESNKEFRKLQNAFHMVELDDGTMKPRIVWDMYPSYYFAHSEYADPEGWRNTLTAKYSDMCPLYDHVAASFDALLAEHGYVRDGKYYRVERENQETLTFFCHFGITCVILSHIWNVSPFLLWQSLCMSTTSVTELITEERQQGISDFRIQRIGDTTHLTMAGLKAGWSARFTDIYSDFARRHD